MSDLVWFTIRGSGFVAYGLLALSTIWGLLLATKVLGKAAKAKPLAWFHESLGLAAVVATAVHMGALVGDTFMYFGPRELLVPGASAFAPLGVAMGVMAFYGMVLVAGSFYVKQWIGQRAWRTIHYLAFGTFVAATTHGLMAGTDSHGLAGFAVYLIPTVIVSTLLAVRIALALAPPRPERRLPERAEPVAVKA